MNIVFVFSDQHRACTTSLEGAAVHTPNLERMAAEGVVCRNTISNIPVCTPWRAAFLINIPFVLLLFVLMNTALPARAATPPILTNHCSLTIGSTMSELRWQWPTECL